MVKLLREVQGVRYELFTLNTLDEMALMVAEAFTHYEPLSVIQAIPLKEFVDFVKLLGLKVQQEELTVIARDQVTDQVIGAIIADDFAATLPESSGHLSERFEPVFALLAELNTHYKQGKNIQLGEYLHLFMIAVTHQCKGKKIAQNLIQACLENSIRKGYKTAVAEATGVISQHILRNKFGFVDRFEIPYKTFTYQGRRVFESIKEHNGIILMDKTLV